MKKIIICFISIFFLNGIYCENTKNKYSTELESVGAIPYGAFDQRAWPDEIDLLRYKTVIRNGIIEEIDDKYLNDLQLGTLTKTELKLLRNFFYAKKGYIFSDKELEKYYSQFAWYRPVTKNVFFTEFEKQAINTIKIFEAESSIKYNYENRDITWEEWNGGADQHAQILKLYKNKTFVYVPYQYVRRLNSITGTWTIRNNKLVLSVEAENVSLGGYVASHPNTPYIDKATSAVIQFSKPIEIILPLNKSEVPEKYDLNPSLEWMKIGTMDCYISW